jgi:hypothetical protein
MSYVEMRILSKGMSPEVGERFINEVNSKVYDAVAAREDINSACIGCAFDGILNGMQRESVRHRLIAPIRMI